MYIDENLAAVHAYLCGDGYVIKNPDIQRKKYYMIGLRNTSLVLLEDFQKKFEVVFGKRPYVTNEGRCRIGSKESYEELIQEFGSFYSYHWTAPRLGNNLSKIWLRAFFDCEGWVTCKSRQNRCIGLDCVNEKGIFQIKDMLEKIGIMCKVKKRNTRNIFSLSIFGRENLTKFRDEINFLHPSKRNKLEEVLNDFVNYDWEFPSDDEGLKDFIGNILINKARVKKDNGVVRIISNMEKNLIKLQEALNGLFDIESRVGMRKNGLGVVYFEMSINKRDEIRKLIKHDLLNDIEKEKWLNLKKSMI